MNDDLSTSTNFLKTKVVSSLDFRKPKLIAFCKVLLFQRTYAFQIARNLQVWLSERSSILNYKISIRTGRIMHSAQKTKLSKQIEWLSFDIQSWWRNDFKNIQLYAEMDLWPSRKSFAFDRTKLSHSAWTTGISRSKCRIAIDHL